MNILWLTNIMLPKIATHISYPVVSYGGWLTGLSNDLLQTNEINFSICFPINQDTILEGEVENLSYYGFPRNQSQFDELDKRLEEIIYKSSPDVIHIFGTEFRHTLDMINVCEKLGIVNKVVVHIQGLVSVYPIHYYAFLENRIVKRFTLRDLLRKDNIYLARKAMSKRGEYEIEALKKAKHVIGRTTWDKACTFQINSSLNYHFCNESLRDSFYQHVWSYDKCEPNSIFISQGNYPIKGLHIVLQAMPHILKQFPTARLYVAGENIVEAKGIKNYLRLSSYGLYIKELIKDLGLENHVYFTGSLSEHEMLEYFLKSNVFVCPSSIENSPNSLGEAMILGVPCVSSDVGGVTDMLIHKKEGFVYQGDAYYMLAHYVCEMFSNPHLAQGFSNSARKHALLTHNRVSNKNRVLEIYKSIVNDK